MGQIQTLFTELGFRTVSVLVVYSETNETQTHMSRLNAYWLIFQILTKLKFKLVDFKTNQLIGQKQDRKFHSNRGWYPQEAGFPDHCQFDASANQGAWASACTER